MLSNVQLGGPASRTDRRRAPAVSGTPVSGRPGAAARSTRAGPAGLRDRDRGTAAQRSPPWLRPRRRASCDRAHAALGRVPRVVMAQAILASASPAHRAGPMTVEGTIRLIFLDAVARLRDKLDGSHRRSRACPSLPRPPRPRPRATTAPAPAAPPARPARPDPRSAACATACPARPSSCCRTRNRPSSSATRRCGWPPGRRAIITSARPPTPPSAASGVRSAPTGWRRWC